MDLLGGSPARRHRTPARALEATTGKYRPLARLDELYGAADSCDVVLYPSLAALAFPPLPPSLQLGPMVRRGYLPC